MRFKYGENKRNMARLILGSSIVLFIVILVGSAVVVRKSYEANLKPVSSNTKSQVFTVQSGSTTGEIADALKSKNLIRSDWAFEWYVRNHQLREQLKTGTYIFNEAQSVDQIVEILVKGKVATDLATILPGKRLEQVKEGLVKAGFTAEAVTAGLEPSQYASHPALTDKPKEASLEGYLYPESFQKTADTKVSDIIKLSLDEMQLRLTPDIRQAISVRGLTLHQGIILASLVEQEVSKPQDRPQVGQVFLKRYRSGQKLESNATDNYAKIDPLYDSYKNVGLPPGPIGNVSGGSLQAIAFPAETDWNYFVSGDDGITHFSKTLAEHEALAQKYCTKLCGR